MTMLVWFLDLWLLDPEFVVNQLNMDMYNGLCDNALKKIRGESDRWKSINLTAAVKGKPEPKCFCGVGGWVQPHCPIHGTPKTEVKLVT